MAFRLNCGGDRFEHRRRECAPRDPVKDALLRGVKPLLHGGPAAKGGNHVGDVREMGHVDVITTRRCNRQYPAPLLADNAPFWYTKIMDIEAREADSPAAIGERLRLLRAALGYTQAQMAERHGVESQQAWGNYEKGERPLDYRIALSIAQKDSASLDWIYRGLTSTLTVRLAELLANAQPPRRGRPRKTA